MSKGFIDMIADAYNCTKEEAAETYKGWLNYKSAKDDMMEREEEDDEDE